MRTSNKRNRPVLWLVAACLTVGGAMPLGEPARGDDGEDAASDAGSDQPYPEYRGKTPWHERIMNDGKNVGDLTGDIAADRPLTRDDSDHLLALANYLIDKQNDWVDRRHAAGGLGDYGHRSGLPALLAVVRDEVENEDVRRAAVRALTFVRDPRVVGYVVEAVLAKPSPKNLVFEALDDLAQFSGIPPELAAPKRLPPVLPPPEDEADRREYAETWLRWWAAQGDAPPLNRMHRFSLN